MTRLLTCLALAAGALLLAACSSASSTSSTTPVTNSPAAASSGTPVSPPQAANPPVPTPPTPYWLTRDVSFVDATHGWTPRANTTDGGKTWNTESLGSLVPSAITFTDPMHGWVAGVSSPDGCGSPPLPCYGLMTSADGGHTWTDVKLPENDLVTQIAAVSAKEAWILQEYCNGEHCANVSARMWRTANGGATWDPGPPFESNTVSLVHADADTALIVTESYVYRITGSREAMGNNPCHLVQPVWGSPFRQGPVSFSDGTHGWMACLGLGGGGTAPGTLYRTEDGGLTWNLIGSTPEPDFPVPPGASPFPGTADDIRFFDAANGWLAGGPQDGIFRTRDGGRTWQLIRIGAEVNRIVYADAANACAMNSGELVCSTDSGQHWTIHDLPH